MWNRLRLILKLLKPPFYKAMNCVLRRLVHGNFLTAIALAKTDLSGIAIESDGGFRSDTCNLLR